jgi:protocatechuate 3,4-dioxygenase beta subunit
MAPVQRVLSLVALLALSFAAPLASQIGQVVVPAPGQTRDAPPPQPQERRIPVGTAMISGSVVSADLGRPIRGARVILNGQASGAQVINLSSLSRAIVTDENGYFSFGKLPAGQFQLSISHSQFLAMNYGQRRYGGQGTYVSLGDGERAALTIQLERGAVITGTVIGPDGEPQRQAQVRGMRYVASNGGRRLQAQNYVQTDDRGMYRMFGLQPGEYVISATPNFSDMMNMDRFNAHNNIIERAIATAPVTPPTGTGAPAFVTVSLPSQPAPNQMPPPSLYLPTFAPGAMSVSDATVVTVKAGEERGSVDVLVRLATATTVQVDLTSPIEPGVNVQYQIRNDDPAGESNEAGQRRDQSGRVYFQGMRPGKYTVMAQTVPGPQFTPGQPPQAPAVLSDAQKMWATVPVEVNGEPLIAVTATLRPARSISGVVIFHTTRVVDLLRSRMTVMLNQAPLGQMIYSEGPLQAPVNSDGSFTLKGVMPGRYTLRANGAGGYLRSAMVSGQDTLDIPLDFTGDRDITDAVLTMADSASQLEGTLTDAAGKPTRDYTMVIASADNRYWVPGTRRIATSRPGADGRYTFSSLPPGSYFLAAVQDLEQGVQFEPEFLRELSRASVPVTIIEGGKTVQDLRVR